MTGVSVLGSTLDDLCKRLRSGESTHSDHHKAAYQLERLAALASDYIDSYEKLAFKEKAK